MRNTILMLINNPTITICIVFVVNKQNTEILSLFGKDSKTEQEVSCKANNFIIFMTFINDVGLLLLFFYGFSTLKI